VKVWSRRLPESDSLRVGVVWCGDPRKDDRAANLIDKRRSTQLSAFSSLAAIEGVTLYSLQLGPGAAEIAECAPELPITDLTAHIRDFQDTAALVHQLDLVVTVDTSVAHLAGAMGKPTWILSRFDGCWRWLLDREDSPWYPSARVFRQDAPGEWRGMMERVRTELTQWAARRNKKPADLLRQG
jgi:hypothetical protein